MRSGIVVLHSRQALLRDLVRHILEPDFEVLDEDAWRARQEQSAPPAPAGIHLLIAPPDEMPQDAALLARQIAAPTVIILGGDGRWGARVRDGVVQQLLVDLAPESLRELVRG